MHQRVVFGIVSMAGKAISSIVLIVACLGAYGVLGDEECKESTLGYACAKELAPFYTVHWTVGGSDLVPAAPATPPGEGEVAFALEGKTTGWVALSFPEIPGIMTPADLVLGWVDDGGDVDVRGFGVTQYSVNDGDENSDIELSGVAVEEEGETTVVFFTLPMEGSNIKLSLEGDTNVNYAIGVTDTLGYHRSSRGANTIQLGKGV